MRRSLRSLLPFLLWVAAFYLAWALLLTFAAEPADVAQHWPIAVAMLFGSYVAGSTPLGGGAVGFPILVLLLGESADLGRQFSFAIQSVGMTSASIYIVCQRKPVVWSLLLPAAITSAFVVPIATIHLAPVLSGMEVKLIFATVWALFGIHTLLNLKRLLAERPRRDLGPRAKTSAGIFVGLVGGVLSGVTGVGIDMVAYIVLVLVFHEDLRRAIATSVILMAWNSLLGIATVGAMGTGEPGLFHHWMAAAPVVILGAPLGALLVGLIPRRVTMVFVALLCLGQFFWTLRDTGFLG